MTLAMNERGDHMNFQKLVLYVNILGICLTFALSYVVIANIIIGFPIKPVTIVALAFGFVVMIKKNALFQELINKWFNKLK